MRRLVICGTILLTPLCWWSLAQAQLIDRTQQPNTANDGIAKSLAQQIGPIVPSPGHGSMTTPDSSLFIISRDPFRSVRRGRQLFQRKFTITQGVGPRLDDGADDISVNLD